MSKSNSTLDKLIAEVANHPNDKELKLVLSDAYEEAGLIDEAFYLRYMLSHKTPPVVYVTYTENTRGGVRIDDGAWSDREDAFIDFNILGVITEKEAGKKDSHWYKEQVEIKFEPRIGRDVYIVVVRYRTGDTFGSVHGAWTIVGIYPTDDEANKICTSIYENTYEGYCCWQGYFEKFEGCNIEKHQIEERS